MPAKKPAAKKMPMHTMPDGSKMPGKMTPAMKKAMPMRYNKGTKGKGC